MDRRLLLLLTAIPFYFACKVQQKPEPIDNVVFKKTTLTNEFLSEGVTVADVNKDGKIDVLAGTFWWQAPDWTRHEITTPYIHPSIDGYGTSFLNFTMDVNQDGWDDLIKVGFPGKETFWYENPKGKEGHWQERIVYDAVGNESPMLVDVDGDGRLDLLCNDPKRKKVIWVSPPRKKSDTAWTAYVISTDTLRATHMFTHGIGFGDINGDGRKDAIIREGWWEAPEDRKQADWTFHPADLGQECAQMYTLDIDGDGDNDVISSSAHKFGVWWHEQVAEGDSVRWVKHDIATDFSQSHGLALEDMNNDGQPDLVTGKRFWAHNGHDPGARDSAVLYWFEYKPGKPSQWVRHLVDNNSGIGVQVTVADINGDRKKDIIIGNKKGVFVFQQE